MAESAVNFVLDRLVPLLELDANMLRGVRRNVEYIRDELQSIRGFIRDADGKEESEEVKAWVNQVRDIAYDIEDTLDEFMLRLAQEHQRHGFLGRDMVSVSLSKAQAQIPCAIHGMIFDGMLFCLRKLSSWALTNPERH
ncbi:hypothetical protein HHK36_020182 [Tetracentron sinense]|uniref:Disease resistance N-terminal domain-containing protein n=1 Tax=Tetracentron sinense TaxID=13715 RepID=A0A834YTL9_TETSI|nr:hypothetical protein HHK36_020182 [Tetracentron sinense]